MRIIPGGGYPVYAIGGVNLRLMLGVGAAFPKQDGCHAISSVDHTVLVSVFPV